MTEQAIEVSGLMSGVLFCRCTQSLLHFADIHRFVLLCSRQLPLRQKILKAWGLRRWASLSPLCPCGRLSRCLSRDTTFLRPQTTMPRPTLSESIGISFGLPLPYFPPPFTFL